LLDKPIVVPMQRSDGCCRIEFKRRAGQTVVDRLYQAGCCKARFSAADEAILINTAGGLTGGDHLSWTVRLKERTAATITTQACEKIYRSAGGLSARVETSLQVEAQASLFWLPQETILFNGSDLVRRIEADVADTGELLCLEALAFGRKAMGEEITQARFADRWRIRSGGRLIHADDLRLEGDVAAQLKRPAIARGGMAIATIAYVSHLCEAKLEGVRACLGETGGASAFSGKLLARVVAEDSYQLRKILCPALECLTGGKPVPKVWAI
jgi:urease accessory protein